MSEIEIDKTARDIFDSIPDAALGTAADFPAHARVVLESETRYAIRAALLAAPRGWKLVPIPPTDEMIDAAQDAHMPFGDMHFAITSAILAAPEPK